MKLIQTNEEERKRRHLWNKTGKREQGKGNEGRKGRKKQTISALYGQGLTLLLFLKKVD